MNSKINRYLLAVISSAILLSACGQQPAKVVVTPTPTPRAFVIKAAEQPYVSLTPRADGHLITLDLKKISPSIAKIEYEFVYSAVDNGNEIEKGTSGTLDKSKTSDEILLGTSSCTNGCKYSYDNGVTGGRITLTLTNSEGQVATQEMVWTIESSSQVKKSGNKLEWSSEKFSEKITGKLSSFYTIVKNPESYSIFADSGFVKDVPYTSPTQ
jgi:hypothetical protein